VDCVEIERGFLGLLRQIFMNGGASTTLHFVATTTYCPAKFQSIELNDVHPG